MSEMNGQVQELESAIGQGSGILSKAQEIVQGWTNVGSDTLVGLLAGLIGAGVGGGAATLIALPVYPVLLLGFGIGGLGGILAFRYPSISGERRMELTHRRIKLLTRMLDQNKEAPQSFKDGIYAELQQEIAATRTDYLRLPAPAERPRLPPPAQGGGPDQTT